MNERAIFFRLLGAEEKGEALRVAVASVNRGTGAELTHEADPASFRLIPGSPFAYWVSEAVRRKFWEIPPFESDGRTVKQGLATADDFRFVRAWWEVPPERILYVPARAEDLDDPEALRRYQDACREATRRGQYWVPFAKGGEYSPYYADVHLVVNWRNDGEEIKGYICQRYPYLNGKWEWVAKNTDYYFRPGLTWPRRTNGLSFRILPSGCIFADKGPAAFVNRGVPQTLNGLNAIVNSRAFYALVHIMLARTELAQSFEVGLIQNIPIPDLSSEKASQAAEMAARAAILRRQLDAAMEERRTFITIPICLLEGRTLGERCAVWNRRVAEIQRGLDDLGRSLDELAFHLYGVSDADRRVIEAGLDRWAEQETEDPAGDGDEEEPAPSGGHGASALALLVARFLSYAVGCAFGRWDARIGKGEKEPPPLPGPFDPLPPCSPGMLVGADGLPAREAPPGYPIRVQWDSILVDDPGHPADIVARVREVLAYLFSDGDPAAIEEEACGILGVRDLREWFRQDFFPFHLKMYSKSRRKAPIYWQLCSERRSYSVWLYYHRLNHDTLFTVLRSYVEPKIQYEEQRWQAMQGRLAAARAAGDRRAERESARRAEAQERLLEELSQFRDQLSAVANSGYDPDPDDGVLLNIAPLHAVVPWKEAEKAWRELRAGKYPWSLTASRFGVSQSGGKRHETSGT